MAQSNSWPPRVAASQTTAIIDILPHLLLSVKLKEGVTSKLYEDLKRMGAECGQIKRRHPVRIKAQEALPSR